ncbi:EamA family transporter [Paraglaciecola sp. MB-3u-78]|uniref:EamA family transporter n=1 Tax=Paraglaciecola sp. MB-3u-78 TaxID=2058332 RepID=UPI000C320F50|nr:EamA family transporter [Paraglaciecola sp. MB-3u-78]PKG98154.1 multidrug transporter [Paraglaciecola sp. MB-3u-78]
MSWVFFTLSAVVLQTFRNALQSKLSANMSTSGVTLARFLFAPPIALTYLVLLYTFSHQAIPEFPLKFVLLVLLASVMQISATSLMVILFKQKNFSVGAGLAKSEALVAAVLGTIFFGSQLSAFGWVGIVVGATAIFVLSGGGRKGQLSVKTVIIGLACGTCFALTSLFVRDASHLLNVPFPHSAAWVLLWVLCIQTSLLVSYIAVKHKSTFVALKNNARMTLATSIISCFGTICWFSAVSLHHVAYVKTLGQVEVLLTMLLATFWLKNKVQKHEIIGLLLIAAAAVLVMWA